MHWSPDSESITFSRYDKEVRRELWTLSLKDKSLAKVTDLSRTGKQSPDGRYTAYSNNTGFWVKPVAGGEAKKIGEATRRFLREHPILWSADGAWVLFTGDAEYSPTELRFFRLADGREVKLRLPARMGGCIGVSPDQKKVFLYRHSYEEREALRVVSVSGGPSFELGRQMSYVDPYSQFWSPDSATVIAGGEWKGDDWNLWALALSGGTPVALKTDVSVPGKIWQCTIVPGLQTPSPFHRRRYQDTGPLGGARFLAGDAHHRPGPIGLQELEFHAQRRFGHPGNLVARRNENRCHADGTRTGRDLDRFPGGR